MCPEVFSVDEHKGQVIGYARVSSAGQKLERQLEAMGPVDRLFSEKVSARSRESRPQLQEMLRYVRAGDLVRVASMDRLARSLLDLQQIIDDITEKGASVTFVNEGQTYSADRA